MAIRWGAKAGVTALLLAAAAAGAVAGTKLKQTAQPGAGSKGPAKKLLVIAVSPNADMRTAYEDMFAGELSLRGATVVPSHEPFPDLPKDRDTLRKKIVDEGFDAVVVSRLVGEERKVVWKEGFTGYESEYQGMDWWGGYWYTVQQVQVPGYLQDKSRVRAQTDFWWTSGDSGQLAWSGTSDSLDPRTAPEAAHDVAVKVAKALAKAGLI